MPVRAQIYEAAVLLTVIVPGLLISVLLAYVARYGALPNLFPL